MPVILAVAGTLPARAAEKVVEVPGLHDAAHVLTALYGQPFNFEGVPLAPGTELDIVERNDFVVGVPRVGHFEFVIRDGSPATEAAQAAVDAWHAAGGPGAYTVVESRGMVHFVPTRRRLDAATTEAWTSPMDLVIDLGVTEGTAPELSQLALARLGEALGEPVIDHAAGMFSPGKRTEDGWGPYSTIKLDGSSGKARDIFDQILERAGGQEAHWKLRHAVLRGPDDPDDNWAFSWLSNNAPLERHVHSK